MKKNESNYAFIDSQNLNLSIRSLGWRLNYKRFRVYLQEKYSVKKAFLFIGFVDKHSDLYVTLQEAGFFLIFKPTLTDKHGKTKGNCDAELVLHTMIELQNYDKAVILTGDGDFYCLVKYLIGIGKLKKLLIPNHNRYSALLKSFESGYIAFVSYLQKKFEYMKRTP